MDRINKTIKTTSKFFATLRRVTVLAWRVSPLIYAAQLFIYVINGLAPLVIAYLAGQVVNALATTVTHHGANQMYVYELVIAAIVVSMISSQLSYLSSYLDDRYSLSFDGYIFDQLMAQFASLDQTYYDDPKFNDRMNKVQQNLFSMRRLSSQFLNVISSIVQLVATAIVLFRFQPILIPVILIAFTPIIAIEVSASFKRWRFWDNRGEDFRLQYYLRNNLLDSLKIREIKLYNLAVPFRDRWRENFESSRRGQMTIETKAQQQRTVAGILNAVVEGAIQVWLIVIVASRGISAIGQFVFYRQAVQNFSSAGQSMIRSLHDMQENSLYVNDYFALLSFKPHLKQPEHAVVPEAPIPTIEFDNVSFRYPAKEAWAMRHVSLTITPGQDVALIGENGAGKTTFVKLLMRLYDPTEGRILIDGVDLRELDLESWNRRLGVLFQDFNKYGPLSLKDNITIGESDRPVETREVERAIDQAGARELVETLPNGYDQILVNSFEGGTDLSGGQWQRVALARSFYRNAPVLILDEPTSAIDAKAEFAIFQEIAATQKEKTTIIISHRFSTVRNADRIIVLDHGQIIEEGSHDELIKVTDGTYHELFETQAAAYR